MTDKDWIKVIAQMVTNCNKSNSHYTKELEGLLAEAIDCQTPNCSGACDGCSLAEIKQAEYLRYKNCTFSERYGIPPEIAKKVLKELDKTPSKEEQ